MNKTDPSRYLVKDTKCVKEFLKKGKHVTYGEKYSFWYYLCTIPILLKDYVDGEKKKNGHEVNIRIIPLMVELH